MIELEKTYLAKTIPTDIRNFPSKEIIDIYIPKTVEHPVLRIRKSGEKYEMTKKTPIKDGDASEQTEQTIALSKEEFDALTKLDGKRTHKIRYYYKVQGQTAEIDIFQDELAGLVLIDFEFDTIDAKNTFTPPDFCLVDVTQETFLAGGMVCGKSYADLETRLMKFSYKPLYLKSPNYA
ncbi:hypothetical protein HZB94_03485 [Candidatus Falkowbacteria bacterium]|nr:hypothetical protein [Candidatus Falkowbacteria bacterium]